MIISHTQIPTDIINNQSDMNMGGTGIGNSSPTINLDEINAYNTRTPTSNNHQYTEKDPFSPYDTTTGLEGLETLQNQINQQMKELQELLNEQNQTPEPKPEPEKTQGQLEQELFDSIAKLEDLEAAYEQLKNFNSGDYKDRNYVLSRLTDEELKSLGITKKENPHGQGIPTYSGINQNTFNQAVDLLKNRYNQEMAELRDKINNIKTNPNYDNRTDQQIREDLKDSTAYQTVVEDMRKAGLNPALIGGVGYAGGGGGGTSKAEEEEKKRKRKRLELLERQRQEQLRQRQEALQILGMLTGMGSFLGGGLIRNAGYSKFWEAQLAKNQTQNTPSPTKPQTIKRNEPSWLDKYLKDIEAMG